MKSKLFSVFFILFLSILVSLDSSDVVVLTNGKSISGTFISQDNGVLIIKTKSGQIKKIKKNQVARVIYNAKKLKSKRKRVVKQKSSFPKKLVEDDEEPENEMTEPETEEVPEEEYPENDYVAPEEEPDTSPESKPMAKNSVKESPRPIENKTTERVIERSNVDKEWVESLIKRIEDIENKREENSKAQLDLTRTELEYLKKDREKLKDEIKRSEETRKELDKRYAETEIRNRRLEKYLAMDETMVDYYKRKRSPWDLVWRSSLFPGWGHRYAREDFVGNTYTTIFLLFIPVGYLIEYQTHAARQIVKDKLIDDVIIRPYSLQSLTGGTVPASFSPTGAFTVKSYIDYNSTMNALDDQERLGQNFYNAAILIYLAQIVHSYFTGVEWAKKEPRDYSNESLKTSRIDFKFKNDPWAGQFTGMGITIKF